MRLLLDTHILLWWLSGSSKLSREGREMIANPDNAVFVSAAVLWEIVIKKALGRLAIDIEALRDAVRENSFEGLSISHSHAFEVSRLPPIHRDPFDRMLIAQSRVDQLSLLTADEIYPRYQSAQEGFGLFFLGMRETRHR